MSQWFYDGAPGATAAFTAQFAPEVRGCMCLGHAKRRTAETFRAGWEELISNYLDMMAFFPDALLRVSVDILLARLAQLPDQAEGLRYVRCVRGAIFHAV